jgi:hypothetical protein
MVRFCPNESPPVSAGMPVELMPRWAPKAAARHEPSCLYVDRTIIVASASPSFHKGNDRRRPPDMEQKIGHPSSHPIAIRHIESTVTQIFYFAPNCCKFNPHSLYPQLNWKGMPLWAWLSQYLRQNCQPTTDLGHIEYCNKISHSAYKKIYYYNEIFTKNVKI